jgi:hypothetical protein
MNRYRVLRKRDNSVHHFATLEDVAEFTGEGAEYIADDLVHFGVYSSNAFIISWVKL